MEEKDLFTGKTYEEAVNNAQMELAIPKDEMQITVVEEGKKKLFGSTKWVIKVVKKCDGGERAAAFIDGLFNIMGIKTESAAQNEEDGIKIEIKTEEGSKVIGKRGEILDAIQCMAGAVANIGREEYVKVVVDCENYRSQREETLKNLAEKVAKKALETGRKVILEPMNRYERRVIHSALKNNEEVKTVSEGREPSRYVVVIPNNARPGDRGIRLGERRDRRDRRFKDRDRSHNRGDRKPRRDFNKDRGGRTEEKRAKKEIRFGTFLGNSGNKGEE